MRICQHETEALSVQMAGQELARNPKVIVLDTEYTSVLQLTCPICGAVASLTIRVDRIKKGKGPTTHRLWAFLKGVR